MKYVDPGPAPRDAHDVVRGRGKGIFQQFIMDREFLIAP